VIIVLTAGQAVNSPASIRTGHTVTPQLRHGGTHRSKTRHSIATAWGTPWASGAAAEHPHCAKAEYHPGAVKKPLA
jgi:hypothetical protein